MNNKSLDLFSYKYRKMYDSTCKFIAIQFTKDIATWLLGKPMELTELKPSELSLEPINVSC